MTDELRPCWLCKKPCPHGLCDDCYAQVDPDVEVAPDTAAVTAREDAENRAIRDEMLRDEYGEIDW